MLEVTDTISEGRFFLFVVNHYCINATVNEVIGRYALVNDEDRGTLSGLVYLEATGQFTNVAYELCELPE